MIQKDVLRLAELGRGMETGLRLEPKRQKGYQNDSEREGFAMIPDCLSCVKS